MSILQEYEQIKKQVGVEEWNRMLRFLELHQEVYLSDLLYNEESYNKYKQWKETN